MTALLSALGAGVSSKKILDYLMRKSPELAPKISTALASGLSAEKILKWFSKDKNFGKLKSSMENEYPMQQNANPLVQAQNIRNQNLGQDSASALQRHLPSIAGGLTAAVAAPYATRAAQGVLARALPSSLTGIGSQSPSGISQAIQNVVNPDISSMVSPSGSPQEQNQLKSSSFQPPVNPTIAQPEASNLPQVKSNIATEILNKFPGVEAKINDMLASKNTPEAIAQYFKQFNPNQTKKLEKEAGVSIQEIISEYVAKKQTEEPAHVEPQGQELDVPEETGEVEPVKIETGHTVASPQGIGEVKAIRNGKAIIEVDGKKHQVNEDELETEPEEVKTSTLEFNPSSVPEELRSAPLNEVYLPHDRRHVTIKYNAGLKPIRYIYFRKDNQPIPTDYINKIVEGVQLPVTSGLNFWGAWDASKSDSRGSANYEELVSNSQEEGEPDDSSKEYWMIKEEALYEHPYLEKAGKEELRRKEKEFNEAKKKRRKKKNP